MRGWRVLGSVFVWSTAVLTWAVGILFATLFTGFVWLTATESGTHWLIAQAGQRIAGLHIDASHGTLWRGLTLSGLQLRQADGLTVDAGQVEVQLDWRQFWHLNLQMHRLTAADVQIHLPSPSDQSPTVAKPLDLNDLPLNLPVGVDVTQLALQRLAVYLPDGNAYRLDDLVARANAGHEALSLRVSRLTGVVPGEIQVGLQGDLTVATARPHRVTGRLQGGIDLPQGWLAVSGRLSGKLSDVEAEWSGVWTGFDLPGARFQARTRITPTRLTLARVALDTLGGTVCAQGDLDYADGWRLALSGRAEALDPGLLAPSVPGRLAFDFQTQLTAGIGAIPVKGQIDLTRIRGVLARLPIQSLTAHLGLADQQLNLALSGDQVSGGSLRLSGRLGLADTHSMTLNVTTRQMDVAPLLASLPIGAHARTDLNLSLQGELGRDPVHDARLDGHLTPLRLDLVLPETSNAPAHSVLLTGDVQGSVQGGRAQITKSEWHWGDARLTAQGDLDWVRPEVPMSLKAVLSVPDLGRIPLTAFGLPAATGSVRLETDLHGTLGHPTGLVALHARHLVALDWRMGQLDVQARVARGGHTLAESPVDASLTATGVGRQSAAPGDASRSTSPAETWLDRLSLSIKGRWAKQAIVMAAQSPEGTLALSATGGMSGAGAQSGWQGRLERLDISAPKSRARHARTIDWGQWRLASPAPLSVSTRVQKLGTTCLTQADSRLCLSGSHQAGASTAALTGNLSLSLLAPWLPEGMHLPGRLVLDAQGGQGQDGAMSGHAQLTLPDNVASLPDLDAGKPFAYRQVRLDARLSGDQLALHYQARVPQLLTLNGDGSVQLTGSQNMNLATRIQMADLGVLAFAVPQATRIAGQAEADISVVGSVAHPRPSGRFQVRGLGFVLPDTGVGYDQGTVDGSIDAQGQLRFTGQLVGQIQDRKTNGQADAASRAMAPGALRIQGTGNLAQLPDWHLDARIDGNAVPVLRLPSLLADASPSLTVQANQDGATIGGSVLLPRVTARIEKLPESAVRSSPDLVIVGAKATPKTTGYPVQGDVALKLGDAVSLAGMGFSTGITGQLNLRLRPEKPLAAFGEIDLKNGVYKAYGQNLAIQSGQLIFVGPLTDPGLSVTASRTVDSDVVGLKIGGTLHDPKTTVYSQPGMPESDALSLLLTGRKLNGSSSTDASMLINAITGLGIAQGDDIARDIGQRFGLDSIGLDTTGGLTGTRLTLGKRIGDNLLVRYAIGVTTGVGEVITEYKLNRLFAIEVTASPTATGGDLIYRIH